MSFSQFQVTDNPVSTVSHHCPSVSQSSYHTSTAQSTQPTMDLPVTNSQPQTILGTSSSSRTRLDEVDQLVLTRLCVVHQSDYAEGKKVEFWAKISILLEQETEKKLKDPASTMKSLVATRRITVDTERLESGTTQPEMELTQALDAWIVRVDTVEEEKSASKRTLKEKMQEMQEAERYRVNLLKPQRHKKKMGDRDTEDGEGGESELEEKQGKKRLRKSVKEVQRQKEVDMAHDDTVLLVSAVQDMSTQMAGAIRGLTSANSSEDMVNTNVHEFQDQLIALEKQGEEQKGQGRRQEELLNKIFGELSRLGQKEN
ncbi:hypothetical protein HOY82DRAFT_541146 [Tuber indicum]|nr:hypothetical protein HOY82DRAFT_541146 [Tuber indicum]